jgi:hypothetical protein
VSGYLSILNFRDRSYRSERKARWVRLALFVLVLLSVPGCRNGVPMIGSQQLRDENARLSSEYRIQKDRADQLAARNQQLESRLGESEKMVAQMLGNKPTSRVSSNAVRSSDRLLRSGQTVPPSLDGKPISTGELGASSGQWKVRGDSQDGP